MTELWASAPLHRLLAELAAEYAEPRTLMTLRVSRDSGRTFGRTWSMSSALDEEHFPRGCVGRCCKPRG